MTDSTPVGVAAFDFDGTLVSGDSFIPFLSKVCGPRRLATQFGASTVSLLLSGGFKLDRDASKADLVARLLTGFPASAIETQGEAFGRALANRVRPRMRDRLEWHRHRGHRLLLVSASPTTYLEPFGRILGFDAVLATRLEVGAEGRLTGRLIGANCRGTEKEARVREWMANHLGRAPVEIWAYGDSAGDRELLAMADHPVTVGRLDAVRRQHKLSTQVG